MRAADLISELEALQSDAVDRLKRNLKPEAHELFTQLIQTYQDRLPELKDIQLTLYFNLLLSCLDRHDAPDLSVPLNGLIECYQALNRPTNATLEVSRQLALWLDRLIADERLIEQHMIETSATDLELLRSYVARDVNSPLVFQDPRFTLDLNIEPLTVARLLRPIDSGIFCYALTRQATSVMTLPQWTRKLYRRQVHTPPIPAEILDDLEEFATLFKEQAYSKAYRLLLNAFKWGVYSAPTLAFEWVIGLVLLEHNEELDSLAYVRSLPLEHRVTLTIKLHRDFAKSLAEERYVESVVLHHWQEVISLGRHHLRVIAHRHNEVSMNLRTDHETKGWLKLHIAEGSIAHGDDEHALLELEEVLQQSRSNTYQDATLMATALSLVGRIHERALDRELAMNDYYLALERALPRYILSYDDIHELEHWFFQDDHFTQRAEQLIIGVKRSADVIRLTKHPEALADLLLLSSLIDAVSTGLSYQQQLDVSIYLGLTRALFGDRVGAERALEASQALDYTSGVALSNLHLLLFKNQSSPLTQDPEDIQRLKQEYERVLKEVEHGCGVNIQRQLLLRSMMLFLHQWLHRYRDLDSSKQQMFERRLTVYLERSHRNLHEYSAQNHLCELSVLVPRVSELELEETARALLSEGLREPAQWLMRLLRLTSHPYYIISPKGRTSQLIKDEHRRQFELTWLQHEEVPPESYQVYDRLASAPQAPQWHQHLAQAQVAILEYFISDEVTLISLSIHGQETQVHQLEIDKRTLEDEVIELLRCLISHSDPDYVLADHCKALYQRLILPFEREINESYRLVICPDQYLNLLPFSVLQDTQGRYLGQRLEIAIALPTARPVFSAHGVRSSFSCVHYVSEEMSREERREQLWDHLKGRVDEGSLQDLSAREWSAVNALTTEQVIALDEHEPATAIILDAELNAAGLEFRSQQGQQEGYHLGLLETVRALIGARAGCCIFTQNVSPYILFEGPMRSLLTAVYGGIIQCRWQTQAHDDLINKLVAHITEGSTLFGLTGALLRLRRHAIEERYQPYQWACLELYIARDQLRSRRTSITQK